MNPATYIDWDDDADRLPWLREHGFISPAELPWTDRILRFSNKVEVTCIHDADGCEWAVAFRRFRGKYILVGTLDMM